MKADFKVCLDACVLANFRLADLFLRLAEKPRLYTPVWSSEILEEMVRTQTTKLGWPEEIAESMRSEMGKSFPQAQTDDYEQYLPALTNDPKDRHVLAATIRAGSSLIVTFNLKDFSPEALEPWSIEAKSPDDYLLTLYDHAPSQFSSRIGAASVRHQEDPLVTVGKLAVPCPNLTSKLIDDLDLA